MKYPATVRRKIEKVRDDVNKKYDIKLRNNDVEDIISKYFGTIRKLMAKGVHDKANTFINRMEVPVLGHIAFNRGVIRRSLERDIHKEVDIEWAYGCYAYIRHKGWKYAMWSQKLGYVYLHEETGTFYALKHDFIKGVLDAHIYFSEIVDSPFVWYNIPVNFNTSYDEVLPLTCKGYKQYTREGELIQTYNTLEEAAKEANCSASMMLWIVLRNKKMYPFNMLLLKNSFWVLNEEYNPKLFYSRGHQPVHLSPIDILDADTNEVLFEHFGTLSDVVKYIRSLRKYTNVKVSPILRVLDKDKRMYGYKFKRSIPKDTSEEAGRSKNTSL